MSRPLCEFGSLSVERLIQEAELLVYVLSNWRVLRAGPFHDGVEYNKVFFIDWDIAV